MSNITEGCRAVVVNSTAGNDGIVVTVGKFLGVIEIERGCFVDLYGPRNWEKDKPLLDVDGNAGNFIDEHYLRRLDDDLGSWESEEMKSTEWTPPKVKEIA